MADITQGGPNECEQVGRFNTGFVNLLHYKIIWENYWVQTSGLTRITNRISSPIIRRGETWLNHIITPAVSAWHQHER